jgi:hypothetical protein
MFQRLALQLLGSLVGLSAQLLDLTLHPGNLGFPFGTLALRLSSASAFAWSRMLASIPALSSAGKIQFAFRVVKFA